MHGLFFSALLLKYSIMQLTALVISWIAGVRHFAFDVWEGE